jgi:hypothetical protein
MRAVEDCSPAGYWAALSRQASTAQNAAPGPSEHPGTAAPM